MRRTREHRLGAALLLALILGFGFLNSGVTAQGSTPPGPGNAPSAPPPAAAVVPPRVAPASSLSMPPPLPVGTNRTAFMTPATAPVASLPLTSLSPASSGSPSAGGPTTAPVITAISPSASSSQVAASLLAAAGSSLGPAAQGPAALAILEEAIATSRNSPEGFDLSQIQLTQPPLSSLTPDERKAVEDPLGTAGLSPEAFLLKISGPAPDVASVVAAQAAADSLLGLAPQAAVPSTPITLASLESGSRADLSFPPALPPNLQVSDSDLADLADAPADSLAPSILERPAVVAAVDRFNALVQAEAPTPASLSLSPIPSENATAANLQAAAASLNNTGNYEGFVSQLILALDLQPGSIAPAPAQADLATPSAPGDFNATTFFPASVNSSELTPTALANIRGNNLAPAPGVGAPGAPILAFATGQVTSGAVTIAAATAATQTTNYLKRAELRVANELYKAVEKVTANVPTTLRFPTKGFCDSITRGMVSSCKEGVKSQVAVCKSSIKDKIASCKDGIRGAIDNCKKGCKWYKQPWCSWNCEARRVEIPKCETQRFNIPLCELDRLSIWCCEGQREFIENKCRAGMSAARLQEQMNKVQTACSVAATIAKAVVKSYASGAAIGFISQIQEVKAVADTVKSIDGFQKDAKQLQAVGSNFLSKAEGGQKALDSLCAFVPSAKDACSVLKKAESQVTKAFKAAAQLESIQTIMKSVDTLKNLQKDIKSIQAGAKACASMPPNMMPAAYTNWNNIRSENEFVNVYAAYNKAAAAAKAKVTECQTVLKKVSQLQSL